MHLKTTGLRNPPRIIVIEPGDYCDPGVGGSHAWARNIFSALGNEACYVCTTHDPKLPLRTWIQRTVRGVTHWCFALYRCGDISRRPLVPLRLKNLMMLKANKSAIMRMGAQFALMATPECMIATSNWGFESICYRFPGIENPIEKSRYPYAHFLSRLHDIALFGSLEKADVILASADERAIASLVKRSRGKLQPDRVAMFPTVVDPAIFHPQVKHAVREALGVPLAEKILLFCGRLNQVKGWDLVLEAFGHASNRAIADKLWLAGDGEDRHLVEEQIKHLGLENKVVLWGAVPPERLAQLYNAADLLVCGSHREGWSQTMLEALSCGKPIVSTDVSGVQHLVHHACNGYVISSRDPADLCGAIDRALELPDPNELSMSVAQPYHLNRLNERLFRNWSQPCRGVGIHCATSASSPGIVHHPANDPETAN